MCRVRKEVTEVRHLENINICVEERKGVHSTYQEKIATERESDY